MSDNSDDYISNEQLERELLPHVKPLDWLLIADILNDRADELEKGNCSISSPKVVPNEAHNDPETLRGIALLARGIGDCGTGMYEGISREGYHQLMDQIEPWRINEEAKDALRYS